jgi:hypothetical protein
MRAGSLIALLNSPDSNAKTQRVMFVVDAHRDDGKRFIARSDEKPTAFLELERSIDRRRVSCCR